MVEHVDGRHHPALEFDTIIAQKHDVLFDKICVALRADELIEKLNKKAVYVEYENSEFAIPIVIDNKLLGHYVRLDGIVTTLRSVDISDDKICDRVINTMMSTEADFRNRDWYCLVARTIKRGRAGLPNTAYNRTKL